ncbi:hypothetical protein RSOLAG1IB_04868 [Rhizoctonia solani AG-1 IB]|uniref:Uncharacterized protein n=1 Tax=Thanatephorus cucumeris (strain AG1-IB / isolate 7/3/14) TaxID=1108050 RepID=A0A0B7G225_THACB|nr:hypothetical protein RSOLAG1IB_04868 [Rhizoctonia solani AG-1 IB]
MMPEVGCLVGMRWLSVRVDADAGRWLSLLRGYPRRTSLEITGSGYTGATVATNCHPSTTSRITTVSKVNMDRTDIQISETSCALFLPILGA